MSDRIPYHLGIIIDGNRRWAKEKGLPGFEGHRQGLNNLRRLGDYILKKGVKVLTIFCFSTENWGRAKREVSYLMRLFGDSLSKRHVESYHKRGIKIQIIGQRDRLPKTLQKRIEAVEDLTRNNKEGFLNLAISYGGRADLLQAVKKIIKQKIASDQIDEDLIAKNLWAYGLPDPDFIIRTGGEMRLSNFLTWQSVYSELYFTPKYWPSFAEKDLDQALEEYARRERRFGK